MGNDLSAFSSRVNRALASHLTVLGELLTGGERVIDVVETGVAANRIVPKLDSVLALTNRKLVIVHGNMFLRPKGHTAINLGEILDVGFDKGSMRAKPGLQNVLTINSRVGTFHLNVYDKSGPAWPRMIADQMHGSQAPAPGDIAAQLKHLSELREAGHLSAGEFAAAKARLLGG
ncbi:hypothetical protein GCM10023191_035130 [Actinoallomurus oryzae]|jgi:hypothetical protein|uniref:SHOCT domain-containing protein n=1 Tax=Actinoallomurus oryzae TaxID=502180 RepID=A0ABP8Q1W6_9ACTN